MKIAFFGSIDPWIINEFFKRKINISVIILPSEFDPHFKYVKYLSKAYNIPNLKYDKSTSFINKFKELNIDTAFIRGFPFLLPSELLNTVKNGFINCHPSLLPDYRGANPLFHTIVNNEQKSGVTIHFMDDSFDTGDIIMQKEITVNKEDTIGSLFQKFNILSSKMLLEITENLAVGEKLLSIPQPKHNKLKKAPKIYPEKGDTIIDWNKDSVFIERFVRACNPWFGAECSFRNQLIKIWSGTIIAGYCVEVKNTGTILKVNKNNIEISTGNGIYIPTVIQIGYESILDIKKFINIFKPHIGEYFFNSYDYTN